MKTLADMTEEERAECVGMWCGYNRHLKGGKPQDFVIMIEDINEAGRVSCINPGAPEPKAWAPDPWMLTPRFDLPRAWHPDGQPPQGEWEDDYTDSDGITLTTGEDLNVGPHQEIRRWIGDWEEA
ncbi:hypothetical protein HMPREF1267_02382 [Corynebacterium sp. KPL1824]|uniref:hypothetical protein n=1 Tax=Corynebacterium sp. KPL1824 TaxID=1203561 RepID=UPI0003B8EC7A|nr:hypothetical protein [Corynebacterium sp. KPL1824]ERS51261.1 hypothetical protein HMPREF1267_02382 [Corynebacterium sp. KPL1824]